MKNKWMIVGDALLGAVYLLTGQDLHFWMGKRNSLPRQSLSITGSASGSMIPTDCWRLSFRSDEWLNDCASVLIFGKGFCFISSSSLVSKRPMALSMKVVVSATFTSEIRVSVGWHGLLPVL